MAAPYATIGASNVRLDEEKGRKGCAPLPVKQMEKQGWIIVQKYDDTEHVVGHGSLIFSDEAAAVAAWDKMSESWDVEVAQDPDAEWLKHTSKPVLRKITWTEEASADGDKGGDDAVADVAEPGLVAQ